ncbi:putative Glucanase [Taphrina deformans PYCC 5710]|uniref:Glucanase n=1 Tax=Taphrina deformans (strain PYCC 5710 / ATCC 11124 / CBS 356.35 / IMI 108563 / JCM 9778 / NBRC 8474) TaxID=1097556 RepID=R4XH93_TAPDE|nr:putative Glucanase [Taphrina deformans PYCC 5710]|eukprot:CCG82766.2 putative Glucanase [Taphrina deformans PYCC 5710]
MSSGFLRVQGDKIVDRNGKVIQLRGAGLGGWMNMENFITGFAGREFQFRESLLEVLGNEKYEHFFDKFLEYFWTEDDAILFSEMGLNCLRLPFNYKHFEDDLNPGVIKEGGFKHLDRVVNICAKHSIYTILDLHTVPGGQNHDWHSDTATHEPDFFNHREFMDRMTNLWVVLAKRYKGNSWVAGYNPLNEPADRTQTRLINWYNQVERAIREVDSDHILFWDANTYASDTHFPDKLWPNSAYSIHDYSKYGFPSHKEIYTSSDKERASIKRSYQRKCEWCKEHNVPIWNGEFGPVYEEEHLTFFPNWEAVNNGRYNLLGDQLDMYDQDGISWSIWTYKDIGYQGMVYVNPKSPYIKKLGPALAKKKKLAVDAWGTDESKVKDIFDPVERWFQENVPEMYQKRYPWPIHTMEARIGRLCRAILMSEYMVPQIAECFAGVSMDELDEMAKSFALTKCKQRDGLNRILTAHKPMM